MKQQYFNTSSLPLRCRLKQSPSSEMATADQPAEKNAMPRSAKKFTADQSGATAIEYALIASLVSVAIIGALGFMSGKLQNTFNEIASNLN